MPLAKPCRLLAVAFLMFAAPSRAGEDRTVTVRWEGRDLGETPIVVPLDPPLAAGTYTLTPEGGGAAIPAVVFEEGGRSSLAFVVDRLAKDSSSRYALERADKPADSPGGVEFSKEGDALSVRVQGRPLTTYRNDLGPKPILFPLIGPTGTRVTRAFPMETVEGEDRDHPHQRSFWFTHGRVNGVDFWTELADHGAIRETSRKTIQGPSIGVLRTTDDWVGPDGKVVCTDERVHRIYATKSARVLDFDVTMKATAGPVTFGDTKEGMFGLRVASALDANRKDGGKITNAEGLTNLDAWGKASPWVDYAGKIDGKAVGIAILNHPDSFRYPTTWHVRDYGLFAANPFGWKDFGRKEPGEHVLPAGESLTFRYRVILHEGDTATADLPSAFAAYATPPKVEISGE